MRHTIAYLLVTLVVLAGCTTEGERAQMRSGLDSINSRNRNDQPFAVQDVAPYVRFFDDHGTPNDRLLAHYLLGRAYYEHGEAPMALECYHDAVECADTTSADCNYAQLARVYGQMAEIFYHQGLYRQQLELDKQSVKYAWLGRDTLLALRNYEQESYAYKEIGLSDSSIAIIEDVSKQYSEHGYYSHAAIALGGILRELLAKGEYKKARYYIEIYESNSGLFDANGNIDAGREIYYYYKGLLYLKESQLDSAEYWFRKVLNDGMDYYSKNSGAYGLAKLYLQRHMNDSAIKYYAHSYAMNDSAYRDMATNTIARMQAMFDYSHQQLIAQFQTQRADRITYLLWFGIAILIILSLFAYDIIKKIEYKRKDAISKYKNSLMLIEQAQYDIAKLKCMDANNISLIAEKERIIEVLQIEIRKNQQKSDSVNCDRLEKKLKESEEYKLFLRYSNKALKPSDEEWQRLHIMMFELFPNFHELLIAKKHLLNKNEFNACFLIRMHFKPADLMNMLGISSAYSNKIRKNLLYKLFDREGKGETFDEMIASIY